MVYYIAGSIIDTLYLPFLRNATIRILQDTSVFKFNKLVVSKENTALREEHLLLIYIPCCGLPAC